tara:strand:- start:445 stop:1185 length:741 start_codon:yes stop_codon:yes gene_type:complete
MSFNFVLIMTRLSVNINKIATLRNARGGNTPDLIKHALDLEKFGAQGITVHPRPDERHIKYDDVRALKKVLSVEFNIEGNPKESSFVDLVLETLPNQVTLVPDNTSQLTSDHGWNTINERSFLSEMISLFKSKNIRTSIFVDPVKEMIDGAAMLSTDRIELYTENYAANYRKNPEEAIKQYTFAAKLANKLEIGINAGHDLNLENLQYFYNNVDNLLEVSIGHALIADALYYGMENTVNMYLGRLK